MKEDKIWICGQDLDIKCPKCKSKYGRILGIRHKSNTYELECKNCLHSEWFPYFKDSKALEWKYVPPKKQKEINDESGFVLPPMPIKKKKR